MSFLLTPEKLQTMFTYFAGLKRQNMIYVMPKKDKKEQTERDLQVLNESQAFLKGVPLKEASLTAYVALLYPLCKKIFERKIELDSRSTAETQHGRSSFSLLADLVVLKDLKLSWWF